MTTKSGTPQWHGDVFDFLRNTALDARNYFSSLRAAYRQNQFGATLGGTPFHKDVALFGDYQGTRLTTDTEDMKACSQLLNRRVVALARFTQDHFSAAGKGCIPTAPDRGRHRSRNRSGLRAPL